MGRNDIYDTPPMRAALGLYAFRQDVHAELIAGTYLQAADIRQG